MNTDKKLMQQALEALEYIEHNYMSLPAPAEKAITAIREALAQPEQEPVGEVEQIEIDDEGTASAWFTIATEPLNLGDKLYTSPPASKPWVGLTDEQRHAYDYLGPDVHDAIMKTEAKLREKNA